MLSVNLRHLEKHEIRLRGELPAGELDFGVNDEMIRAKKPLRYDLTVEKLPDAILVQGKLEMVLDCHCVRCLKPFEQKLELEPWTLHLPLAGEEKVSLDGDFADLTPFVREDILLEFPRHPLCQLDCAGLRKTSKGRVPKTGGEDKVKSSAWCELDKLKL